jgi:transcriptional/translational regulatory protein YebC/TACO1
LRHLIHQSYYFIVKDTLINAELEPSNSEIIFEPANRINLNLGDGEKFMKLIDYCNKKGSRTFSLKELDNYYKIIALLRR